MKSYLQQKILRFGRWDSAVPRSIKRAIVIGALHRIFVNSSNATYAVTAIIKIFVELNILGFPLRFLRRVLVYFFRKNMLCEKAVDCVFRILSILIKNYSL